MSCVPCRATTTTTRLVLLLLLMLHQTQIRFPRGMDASGQHFGRGRRQFVLCRRTGQAAELHAYSANFGQIQTALATIAFATRRDGIGPIEASALATRHNVIQRQVAGMKQVLAILTPVFIAQKDIALGKGGCLGMLWHIVRQGNDGRQGYLEIGGPNGNIGVHVHDRHLAGKDGLDGFLPIPKAER